MTKLNAQIITVIDGDTFTAEVFTDFLGVRLSQTIKVRMAAIDAPETKGSEKVLGAKAKAWLKDRIEGKTVAIEAGELDVYGAGWRWSTMATRILTTRCCG
jgi:endonuclease YncB( thermonuclease family)